MWQRYQAKHMSACRKHVEVVLSSLRPHTSFLPPLPCLRLLLQCCAWQDMQRAVFVPCEFSMVSGRKGPHYV